MRNTLASKHSSKMADTAHFRWRHSSGRTLLVTVTLLLTCLHWR